MLRRSIPLFVGLLLLILTNVSGALALQQSELIPREVFFGNPQRTSLQISPRGDKISFLAPLNNVLNVWVQNLNGEDTEPHSVTSATDRPIRSYFWASNSRQIIFQQDRDGDENFRMYAASIDDETAETIELTPYDGIQARLVGIDRKFPDEILVAINNRVPQLHDVWRINTWTGESEMVYKNEQGFISFMADPQFNVRLAMRFSSNGVLKAYLRRLDDLSWDQLIAWGPEDNQTSGPIGFSEDGNTLYLMDSRESNTGRLYAYFIDDDMPSYDLLASDPRADLSEVQVDPLTGRPQAVGFEYARLEWQILDDSIRADWEYLSQVDAGEMNITSRSADDRVWTVSYERDDGPVGYYIYDRDRMQADFLFTNRPELEGLPLASMEPVIIPSRDGLNLVSYLTRPVGREKERLPMVLFVHGGPWARDSWGYNSIHQWLANRGYAVLSVNFRGSTGFGKDFVNAGDRQWAAKMHDDLVDAVEWAVEQRIADPERVAIMGGSYGGYAALVGLTFTPELFAAGVDIVGPSHIKTLLESIPPYWEPIKIMFDRRVGSLEDPDYLDSISPLMKVDAITKPLLIGQGRNDPRVKEAESQRIVDAMKAKELPVTYVIFPDEGHGFARPNNNLAFFAITEAFLSLHLGGAREPIGSEIRQSSALIKAGAGLIPGLSEAIDTTDSP